jgi:hypothetical protein
MPYGLPYGFTFGGLPPVAEVHIDAALANVLEQYRDQPDLEKLLRIFVARWQTIENVLQTVLEFRLLDVATGSLLAVYGKLLALPRRGGWTDEQWRFYLRLKVQALKSSGTADELRAIADAMVPSGSTGTVRLFPEYPRAYRIEIPDVPADLQDLALELLELATAAPERIVVVFFTAGAGFAFRAPGTTYGFGHGRFGRGVSSEEHS